MNIGQGQTVNTNTEGKNHEKNTHPLGNFRASNLEPAGWST